MRSLQAAGVVTGILSGNGMDCVREAVGPYGDAFRFIAGGNGAHILLDGTWYDATSAKQREELAFVRDALLDDHAIVKDTGCSVAAIMPHPRTIRLVERLVAATSLRLCPFSHGISAVAFDKADGLAHVERLLGMPLVPLVVGDAVNDLPLFAAARRRGGLAAVVGNSDLTDGMIGYRACAAYGLGVVEAIHYAGLTAR